MEAATRSFDPAAYAARRLGIMQPYFFPYLGYFGLISCTDRWIVFDPVQYIRKGWINRNRILSAAGGEKFIGVPVASHARDTFIRDMHLAPNAPGFDEFVRQLDAYVRLCAPYYEPVVELLRACFEGGERRLVPFLTRCLGSTCEYLGIPFQYQIYSDMELDHPAPRHPMDWSLFTCRAVGASQYVNLPGGRSFFDPVRFREAGIELLFYEQEFSVYQQGERPFVPGLSIIDVMMFNSPARIREMLGRHRLLEE